MKNIIQQIESIIGEDNSLALLSSLKYDGKDWISGKLRFIQETVSLDFDIQISKLYPLTIPNQNNLSIRFFSEAISGYAYTFLDNSLCIHPPKSADLKFKFLAEIELVKEWIDKYYVKGLSNTRYSFLPYHFERNQKTNLIYTNSVYDFKGGEFGHFEYINLSNHIQLPFSFDAENLICLGHGKKRSQLSKQFVTYAKKKSMLIKKGLWIFLDKELNVADNKINRAVPTNWSKLENYLSKKAKFFIYKTFFYNQKQFNHNGNVFLMLGYPIEDNNDIQWLSIKMDRRICPIEVTKTFNNETLFNCKNLNIHLSNAENISYHKYFGRGVLNTTLTNRKILIIGVGALGSVLSETLVRGGCKNIDIVDYDIVQTGNICRSNYILQDIGRLKIESLTEGLLNISPFLNINRGFREFPKVLPNDKANHKKVRNELKEYDFIFDCSSDTDVLFVLDKMRLDSQVLSLSISNKAKDFICVTGANLAKQKDFRFSRLKEGELDFYEDVGCGYSTFRASYNDISMLMQYGVKKINHQLKNEISLNSFVLSVEEDEKKFQIEINDY